MECAAANEMVSVGHEISTQVKENMKTGELVDKLDDAVLQRIEQILQNKPI